MMAQKARLMRDVLTCALTGKDEDESLRDQWQSFQKISMHNTDADQFADVYAQTITYGLFTARLHDQSLETFTREKARGLIPCSNPFLRQLFDYVCGANLDNRVVLIVDALCEMYRAADIHAILTHFGRSTERNDPIVHFYEDFLAAYDSKLRKARGVWYTPEPVVNFIVRAVDEVLKTHFKLPEGLADTSKVTIEVDGQGKQVKQKLDAHRVQLLDVATGTGTFTAEAIKQIYSRFVGQEDMWSAYVEEHLLPRLHGFEILMASYAMCHLKIDMLLQETGYKPKKPNNPPRLGVYLTNALEEHHPDVGTLFATWLAKEANEASRIKKDIPIMVAYGNPPYSVNSQNKSEWIQSLITDYKKGLNERNIKSLSDDYIKFIRFAEYHIAKTGSGIVAMITNNSFLDGIIHRQMRKHLLETFDHIYILDLHGNARKKEVAPDGSPDENVFDIMQGVAISIMVKDGSRNGKLANVKHADLYGRRKDKYESLWKGSLSNRFQNLDSSNPHYFFVPRNYGMGDQYNDFIRVTDLFCTSNIGIITECDEIAISYSPKDTENKRKDLLELNTADFLTRYSIDVKKSTKVIQAANDIKSRSCKIIPVNYRPFDNRFGLYTGKSNGVMARPRNDINANIIGKNNICLTFSRTVYGSDDWRDVLVAKGVIERGYLATRVGNNCAIFPLYLYPETSVAQTDLINALDFKPVPYTEPNYFFCVKDETSRYEYEKGFSIAQLMPMNVTGVITARDGLVISADKTVLLNRIKHFADLAIDDATISHHYFGVKKSAKYHIGESRGWELNKARIAISNNVHESYIKPIMYRLFDSRFIYYTPDMVDCGREKYMCHLLSGHNYGLITCRQAAINSWEHVSIVKGLVDDSFVSNRTKERGYCFPLYLYPETSALENTLQSTGFSTIEPNAPNYLFIPFNDDLAKTYRKGFSVSELMPVNSVGIVTARDDFVIDMDESTLQKRIQNFLSIPSAQDAKKAFALTENQSFKVEMVKKEAAFKPECITPISYRPFDMRNLYYNDLFIERSRREVMRHFLVEINLGLAIGRQGQVVGVGEWNLVSLLAELSDLNYFYRGGVLVHPLYLYPDTSAAQTDLINAASTQRKPNLNEKIVATIAKKLDLPFVPDHEDKNAEDHSCFSPLDLLDYIYAVLHSPTYRSMYKEFLKIDFPRIPYPTDARRFWQLVALGGELRMLHLLEHPTLAKPITTYPVSGDHKIEKPTYADGKVYINKDQYFDNVPEVAWNFYIGGYQPAQKWLKDRKGRTLTLEDLRHYAKIILALTETDRLMKAIAKLPC